MSTHTPGPWWTEETGVRNSGGYIVHTTSVSRYADQNERYEFEVKQRESDKQLIAAAPDLLEELNNCFDLLNTCFPDAPVDSCIGVAIVKARAAIEKATGVSA